MRKRLDVEVSLDDFFDNPTIAGVVDSLADETGNDLGGTGTGTGTDGD
jgi:hypothetical protein